MSLQISPKTQRRISHTILTFSQLSCYLCRFEQAVKRVASPMHNKIAETVANDRHCGCVGGLDVFLQFASVWPILLLAKKNYLT